MSAITLTFGKYEGLALRDVPDSYLAWLANPTFKQATSFQVPAAIQAAAATLHAEKLLKTEEQSALKKALSGQVDKPGTLYVIERLGDIEGLSGHASLGEALDCLDREYPVDEHGRATPDPEDDRILIWEVLESGHRKVVWHFSGWHWDAEEFDLDQGELPGDELPLYELALRE